MLSPADMLIIGTAALLFFGPDQLPKVARRAGQVVREVQATSTSFIREIERAAEDPPYRPPEAHEPYAREPHVPAPYENEPGPITLSDPIIKTSGATPADRSAEPSWPDPHPKP